jgi:hypothetical protein
MKQKIKEISYAFLSLLMVLGGLQILFGGYLENTSASNSIHTFEGIERLMGFGPIIIGSFFFYFIIKNFNNNQ